MRRARAVGVTMMVAWTSATMPSAFSANSDVLNARRYRVGLGLGLWLGLGLGLGFVNVHVPKRQERTDSLRLDYCGTLSQIVTFCCPIFSTILQQRRREREQRAMAQPQRGGVRKLGSRAGTA